MYISFTIIKLVYITIILAISHAAVMKCTAAIEKPICVSHYACCLQRGFKIV